MAESDDFYIELREEVDTILAEFGTTYSVRTKGTYNSDELDTTVGKVRAVSGIIDTQESLNNFAALLHSASAVNSDQLNKKSLLLTASAAPKADEEVQVDGDWFSLSKLTPIKPADIVVVYMLDITK